MASIRRKRPPRLRRFCALRGVLFMAQPPLLKRRGVSLLLLNITHRSRKVRFLRCRNYEDRPPFDLDVVISEFESPPAELAVPCHHDRLCGTLLQFVFAPSKRLRHVVETLDAGAHGAQ